jgi:hypothetical protein
LPDTLADLPFPAGKFVFFEETPAGPFCQEISFLLEFGLFGKLCLHTGQKSFLTVEP